MGREDWAFEDIKKNKNPEKDQSVINVNFTHANDYLVLKFGTIGLSGHFFLKWLKRKV